MKSRNTHSHVLSFAHYVHTLRQDIVFVSDVRYSLCVSCRAFAYLDSVRLGTSKDERLTPR